MHIADVDVVCKMKSVIPPNQSVVQCWILVCLDETFNVAIEKHKYYI